MYILKHRKLNNVMQSCKCEGILECGCARISVRMRLRRGFRGRPIVLTACSSVTCRALPLCHSFSLHAHGRHSIRNECTTLRSDWFDKKFFVITHFNNLGFVTPRPGIRVDVRVNASNDCEYSTYIWVPEKHSRNFYGQTEKTACCPVFVYVHLICPVGK